MENKVKSTKELLDEILSGDSTKVWSSSCAIRNIKFMKENIIIHGGTGKRCDLMRRIGCLKNV